MTITLESGFVPPTVPHTHTVVFLHGRGDKAKNFAISLHHSRNSRKQTLFEALPSFRWVFPQAPIRQCASLPERWPQWFDVWNTEDFTDREELQAEGLKEVVPLIRDILSTEVATLGGQWHRVILMGISMGGATSVHTLINLDIPIEQGGRLGAFIGFSCRCPFPGRTLPEMRRILDISKAPEHDHVLRNTPMLLEHCVDDPLVLVQGGRELTEILKGYGAQVDRKEYPNGGHWFNSPKGMDDMVEFLEKHVLTDGDTAKTEADDRMDLS